MILSPKQRFVLKMIRPPPIGSGLSIGEAAVILKITERAVRGLIARGQRRLLDAVVESRGAIDAEAVGIIISGRDIAPKVPRQMITARQARDDGERPSH